MSRLPHVTVRMDRDDDSDEDERDQNNNSSSDEENEEYDQNTRDTDDEAEDEQKKPSQVINRGTHGCIIPIPNDKDSVLKVLSEKDAKRELAITKEILKIEDYGKWAIASSTYSPLLKEELYALPEKCQKSDKVVGITLPKAKNIQAWIKEAKAITKIRHHRPIFVLKFMRSVASALAQLHKHHMVHRDLKPDNVVASYTDDLARLIDFGFSASTNSMSVPLQPHYGVWPPDYNLAILKIRDPNKYEKEKSNNIWVRSYPKGLMPEYLIGKPLRDQINSIRKGVDVEDFNFTNEASLFSVDIFSFGAMFFNILQTTNVQLTIPEQKQIQVTLAPNASDRPSAASIVTILEEMMKKRFKLEASHVMKDVKTKLKNAETQRDIWRQDFSKDVASTNKKRLNEEEVRAKYTDKLGREYLDLFYALKK